MRYTIAKENEVKAMAEEGKSLEYISSVTGIAPKVIWQWCPQLRPHEDVIKQSVKQRFHFIFPDFEAKISSAFSPFVREDITDDDWEMVNKVIYDTLYEESLYVFKNAITDPPDFGSTNKLSEELFLDYMKKFWSTSSDYAVQKNLKPSYIESQKNSIHYWSILRNKKLKDITKGDIQIVHEKLESKGLSASRISQILKTGLIPLRYAYENKLTLLKSYDYQLPKKFQRKSLSIESSVLSKIFNSDWKSSESFIANLIGCYAKMQLREVRALRLKDIFTDGFILSSNIYDKGNLIENPNKRIIKVDEQLIDCILKYTSTSPYKDFKQEDFVFYSINRNSPSSAKNWTNDLRTKFEEVNISSEHINFAMWS